MANIKWESKEVKDKEQKEREKFKGKDFKKLSQKEKDELLEKIARQLGYL
ncbi:hypothetical protein [Proteiniclasticum sp.]|nr:hypothetical protein [Proteiniclasticum sp.]